MGFIKQLAYERDGSQLEGTESIGRDMTKLDCAVEDGTERKYDGT